MNGTQMNGNDSNFRICQTMTNFGIINLYAITGTSEPVGLKNGILIVFKGEEKRLVQ